MKYLPALALVPFVVCLYCGLKRYFDTIARGQSAWGRSLIPAVVVPRAVTTAALQFARESGAENHEKMIIREASFSSRYPSYEDIFHQLVNGEKLHTLDVLSCSILLQLSGYLRNTIVHGHKTLAP